MILKYVGHPENLVVGNYTQITYITVNGGQSSLCGPFVKLTVEHGSIWVWVRTKHGEIPVTWEPNTKTTAIWTEH